MVKKDWKEFQVKNLQEQKRTLNTNPKFYKNMVVFSLQMKLENTAAKWQK